MSILILGKNSAAKLAGVNIYGVDKMVNEILTGVLIPFVGTTLGAACVFFVKEGLNKYVQRALTGFAAGVMVAASFWSLLLPSLEHSAELGKYAFLPAVIGFWCGVLFLLLLDFIVPHLHIGSDEPEGLKLGLKKTTMMLLAVTLHNIPEGMAVGVVLAGYMSGTEGITSTASFALCLGIALQNFPEGAIISVPLKAEGAERSKAFYMGVLSGVVEPLASVFTIVAVTYVLPVLPYMLSFAAGAMIYVVVEELIPEMSLGEHSNLGTIFFTLGFTLMLILEVILE